MRAPEEHPHPVLRRAREAGIPEQHLPVERPALAPERGAERLPMRVVSRRHEPLQMVPGDQLMVHRRHAEVRIVPAHAHQLVVVRHRIGRVRDLNDLAAEEEG